MSRFGTDSKTALALQVLHSLLNSPDSNFDAIVWVSAKTTQLTESEILRIEGAINTSIGIFERIADQFEPGGETPLARVHKLMSDNKILLVIDNLETVLDATIRDFASDVPGESKILFTSRVPLGSDLTVNVGEFNPDEARHFLFRLRDAYQIERLRKARDVEIDSYLRKLGYKPLLIKWFALGVQTGLQPDAIVRDPSVAVKFCMENVVDTLSEGSRTVLRAMSTLPGTVSAAVLDHILGGRAAETERALSELYRFALIDRDEGAAHESKFFVKPFARSYVVKSMTLGDAQISAYVARYRETEAAYQIERGSVLHDPYNPRTFVVRSRSEALIARRLRHAVGLSFRGKYDQADSEIEEVKIAAPDYFEVYRAEAFIAYRMGDYPRAHSAYEAALEIERSQPQLYFFFAGFLMRVFYDYESARGYYKAAMAIDHESVELFREAARNYFFLFEFDEAKLCIDRAEQIGSPKPRDKLILSDVTMQYYIRLAEHKEATGDPSGAAESLRKLADFLSAHDQDMIDQIMIGHLQKVRPIVQRLRDNQHIKDFSGMNELLTKIMALSPAAEVDVHASEAEQVQMRSGTMKPNGRTETFAFLRDIWGQEVYIARASVSEDLWNDMLDGQRVMYEVGYQQNGKSFAKNVTRL